MIIIKIKRYVKSENILKNRVLKFGHTVHNSVRERGAKAQKERRQELLHKRLKTNFK